MTPTKGKVAKDLKIEHAVDDKLENCVDFKVSGVDNVYVFDRRYNQSALEGFIRVKTWDELMGYLCD